MLLPPDNQTVVLRESARLAALAQYAIADTGPEPEYDELLKLSVAITGMPISGIAFIGKTQLWVKAGIGIDACSMDRSLSFCQYTINNTDAFIINDASKDPLFEHHALVEGAKHVRFYLGLPLRTPEGFNIGALYVMDTKPCYPDKSFIENLKALVTQVMLHLEKRRQQHGFAEQMAIQTKFEYFKKQQNILMENIAKGASMADTFEATIRLVEEQIPDALGAIRFLDSSGTALGSAYSNHIPQAYLDAVRGLKIDPKMATNQPTFINKVIVTSDIMNDPLWADFKELAVEHGLRACWWHPIFDQKGEVLGFFALYSKKPHSPNQAELEIVAETSHLLGIAIQRDHMQKHLEMLEACISKQNDILIIMNAEKTDDGEPRIMFVNDAFMRHTGYASEDVMGQPLRILQGSETQPNELKKMKKAMSAWQPVKTQLIHYKKNNEPFWLDLDIMPISEHGVYTHWIALGRDVTDTKNAEAEIRHLAYYDALTDLPNRRLLMDRLNQALLANNRYVRHGALLYLDLDHFKNLNDTAGHAVGDILLKLVAIRLLSQTREDDTVARMGGDEFVVMLKDLDGDAGEASSQAKIVAEKILADFRRPFIVENQEYYSSPSIGITVFDDQKNAVEEILKRADLAMYQAKASGRNSLRFFETTMQEVMTTRTLQEKNLRTALHRNELVLFYQPKVNANDEVVGTEALVRWQSPEKGLLPPSAFIDLAEETGLILPLGDWVLNKACQQLHSWESDPSFQKITMSVNVSVNQFNRPDFVEQVIDTIRNTGANPKKLVLEITESIFAENIDDIVDKMCALKKVGVRFALDDFGVAYSSLSHLRNLPLDEIKIDQSFVKNIMNYAIDLAVAKSVIEIAKSLKIQVVAEGIETEAQREMLTAYGCYVHQGYLFAKPMPILEFESYCHGVQIAALQRAAERKAAAQKVTPKPIINTPAQSVTTLNPTAPTPSLQIEAVQIEALQKNAEPKHIIQKVYTQKTIQQRTKH